MLNNIQALRALAAFAVVICHLTDFDQQLLGPTLVIGGRGVTLFFVISGFIMVYTTTLSPTGPREFLTNRVLRIVPMYWLMTFVIFAGAWFLPTLFRSTRADFGELGLSLFFIPFEKGAGEVFPLLTQGWTLNYEMIFYGLFAVSLALRNRVLSVILVSTILLVTVTLGHIYDITEPRLKFLTRDIQLEFVFGMLVGLGYFKLGAYSFSKTISAIFVALGVSGLFILPYFVATSNLGDGVFATMLVIGALGLEADGLVVTNRFILLLGSASYALYLTHPFPIVAIQKTATMMHWNHGLLLALLLAGVVAICLIVAIATHLAVERPMTRWLRNRFMRRGDVGKVPQTGELEPVR